MDKECLPHRRKQQHGYPNDTNKNHAQKWVGKDKRRLKKEKNVIYSAPPKVRGREDLI